MTERCLVGAFGCAALFFVVTTATAQTGPLTEPTPAWRLHLRTVDAALARGDISRAVRAWHDGYVTALASRRWESLIDVGGAYLRLGEITRMRKASEPKARQLYLAAFFRARQAGSIEGVLRAAESFAALGDRDVAEQCLRAADRLAGNVPRDADVRARMEAARGRVAAHLARTARADEDPVAWLRPDDMAGP